jgi:hypothetical protein
MGRNIAVVIGNDKYNPEYFPELRNSVNDAVSICRLLTDLGFEAKCLSNLDYDGMLEAIASFESEPTKINVALLFYAGHALQFKIDDNFENCLIPVGTSIKKKMHLGRTIKVSEVVRLMEEHARYRLVFLDACRDNALPHLLGREITGTRGTAEPSIVGLREEASRAEGTLISFATQPGRTASDGAGAHSPYTNALLECLKKVDLPISGLVKDIAKLVEATTNGSQQPWNNNLETRFSENTLAEICEYPVESSAYQSRPSNVPLWPNAITYSIPPPSPFALSCLVVQSDVSDSTGILHFVRTALDRLLASNKEEISAYLNARVRLRQVKADSGNCAITRALVKAGEASKSQKSLLTAVSAVCMADVVIFDVTHFHPAVMILLGIRSAAKRGISICSYGDDHRYGAHLAVLPFNLQLLNISCHSRAQELSANPPPEDLFFSKILYGVQDFVTNPDYEDLPSFFSLRNIDFNSRNARNISIDLSEKILILCPFTEAYQSRNWRVLTRELPPKILAKLQRDQENIRREQPKTEQSPSPNETMLAVKLPKLLRLLDEDSPRLVNQSLYEMIRRVDLCLIDWTGFRPNVMFELGVRLAINRLGAVHVIAENANIAVAGEPEFMKRYADIQQVKALLKIFEPISYSSEETDVDPKAFEDMIDWFNQGRESGGREIDSCVYKEVGRCLANREEIDLLGVRDELVSRANKLIPPNEEKDPCFVVYSDVLAGERVNPILDNARITALNYRIAAWSFMDICYREKEFIADNKLKNSFLKLGYAIISSIKRYRHSFDEEAAARMKDVSVRISNRLSIVEIRWDVREDMEKPGGLS